MEGEPTRVIECKRDTCCVCLTPNTDGIYVRGTLDQGFKCCGNHDSMIGDSVNQACLILAEGMQAGKEFKDVVDKAIDEFDKYQLMRADKPFKLDTLNHPKAYNHTKLELVKVMGAMWDDWKEELHRDPDMLKKFIERRRV